MAQTKNLVVTSLQTNGDKVFIRVGDSSPQSTSTNSSAIQFLQDSEKTFATSGTQSAFRIRHNSQDSQLVFQVSNRDGDTYSALTINDLGGINVNSVLTFENSQFIQLKAEDITAKHIVMNNTTQITGTYGILFKYMPPGIGEFQKNYLATIIYNIIGTPVAESLVLLEQEPPAIICQSNNYSDIINAYNSIYNLINSYYGLTDVIQRGSTTALLSEIPLTISKSADAYGDLNIYSDNLYVAFFLSYYVK